MQYSTRLPGTAALRCFEVAAKYQNYTQAAEELGLSQGAISRHVKSLEAQIGATLFRRDGRGVRLTNAGLALSEKLGPDLARLGRSIAQAVAAGADRRLFSIAVLPTFGARWLMPRLGDFRHIHGDLEFMITCQTEPFDLLEKRVDLAIHFGRADWPGARLVPLCPEDLVAVASPSLIQSNGIKVAADLLLTPMLHMSSRPHLWESFKNDHTKDENPAVKGSYFDQFSLIIAAAVGGLGAAILPTYLIESELADGSLVSFAPVNSTSEHGYFVATPLGIANPLASDFTKWLSTQVSRRPKSQLGPFRHRPMLR